MILDIIINFLLQAIFTIGIIVLFGLLIALCNKKFYENFGNYGRIVCYITGAIGTPIHECSHALFCLIFFHKITEIKLFQINSIDGTLGFVNHTYNKKNIYQKIGNFFIGIAPIIVIAALLYLLAWLLLPDFVKALSFDFQTVNNIKNIKELFSNMFDLIKTFFIYSSTWQWWVFINIGMLISLHMTLSKADIKSSLSGFIFFLATLLIFDIVIRYINVNLLIQFTKYTIKIGSYLICVFSVALIVSCVAVLLSFLFLIICRYKQL